MRVYRALDLPPAELAVIAKSPLIVSGAMPVITAAGLVLIITWTLWLKRYFSAPPAADRT